MAMDSSSFTKSGNTYNGTIYALPDRGWNTEGTLNYQNRIHVINFAFTPKPDATVKNPASPNLELTYVDTILLNDPTGMPTSGLDPNIKTNYLKFPGFDFDFPSVNYTGNGYGGKGSGGFRVCLDSEGLFLGQDGSFWVSDEYGPYMYQFDTTGTMINAIQPPNAFIPLRHGKESFSADSPPIYDPKLEPTPNDNPTGRNNNQGFEGMTTNPAGTKLFVLIQSALNQEGGLTDHDNGNARFLVYDITASPPKAEAEYVVPLPHVDPSDSSSDIAGQSEIHYISDTQFLVLARDSDSGRGQDSTKSIYRHVDVFDISRATNVLGKDDCFTCSIASKKGKLSSSIEPAEYCPWLDFNVNSQLRRFGVHNGGADNRSLLNEKWESMALLPVDLENPTAGEYYLFSMSDNDFITQDGYLNFGKYKYKDDSGDNLLNQALVFKVKLPKGSSPLIG